MLKFQKKNGRTRLTDCYQQSPLKASRELYISNNNEKATVYLMESSGGLVAGDCNEYEVHLSNQANVSLVQQSALKVYPSINEQRSTQRVFIQLDQDTRLEWLPETIIPFKDAQFYGNTQIRMKKGSTLLWGEIISPGREKGNECFRYKDFRTSFQIWVEEECLAYDTLTLSPASMPLQQIGLLGESLYIGSLWFVSPAVHSISMKDIHDELKISENINAGITTLDGKGIHLRCSPPIYCY